MSGFEELGIMSEIVRAVDDMQWYLPRPVQQEAVPLILGGGDVLCAADGRDADPRGPWVPDG